MPHDQKVNCKIFDVADGSKHLVFTVDGTGECVGEVRVSALDERYLLVISELFSTWAHQRRNKPIASTVRRVLNGSRHS